MITHLAQAAGPVAAASSSGPSWTEQLAAIAAAVAAGATLLAATAAFFALVFARRAARAAGQQVGVVQEQTRQAGELERERSRAHVVVFAELSPVSVEIADVVIANLGATGAHDVRVSVILPLVRAPEHEGAEAELVGLPQVLPFLAPGQRWSTLWDSTRKHYGQSEPSHEVSVSYRDTFGAQQITTTVLDWSVYDTRIYTDVYGVHHAAKALRAMDKTLAAWSKSTKVVKVATYDGARRDKRTAAGQRTWERKVAKAERHRSLRQGAQPDQTGQGVS